MFINAVFNLPVNIMITFEIEQNQFEIEIEKQHLTFDKIV